MNSGLDVEIDNSGKSSVREIPAITTKHSDVKNIQNEFQLRKRSDRLHEVAKIITFWK